MAIDSSLPGNSGTFKYVVFMHDGNYALHLGEVTSSHLAIASEYLREHGVDAPPETLPFRFLTLGVKGGGHLDWDPIRGHVVFRGNCFFGNPKLKTIDSLMEGSSFTFDSDFEEPEIDLAAHERPYSAY